MGTVNELFSVQSLMAPAVSLFEDLEPWPMVEMFQTGIRKEGEGDTVRWDREDLTRELAPFTDIDAGAIRLFPNDRDHLSTPLASIRIERFIPGRKIWVSERGHGEMKANAASHVRRAMRHLENAMRRAAEYVCTEVLFNPTGATVDATTVPGTEVEFTLDFSIPTTTAVGAWTTISTEIVSEAELLGMKDDVINASGMSPTTMIFNNTGADMLFRNTQISSWLLRTEPGIRFLNQIGPAGAGGAQGVSGVQSFGGIAGIQNWWQFDHGYTPIGGAFTKFLSTDNFILGPGGGPTLGFGEGLSVIPTKAIGSDGLDMIDVKAGPVTYALLKDDPVGIRLIRKWDFVPVVLIPQAWRRLDPTP